MESNLTKGGKYIPQECHQKYVPLWLTSPFKTDSLIPIPRLEKIENVVKFEYNKKCQKLAVQKLLWKHLKYGRRG